MAWKGYAPTNKAKVIKTPRVDNKKPKDKNPVTGSRAARPQKPVTWS
jgi:hypothetical protein|tara:strand:+ start:599 stop:739 length:141 start_codon:yes stop_codon:yes gene_type:complete